MVPILLLTGFLGSGKTTLLNRLLEQRPESGPFAEDSGKLALIVNEFGDVGIDSDLLPDDRTRQIEIKGGCICCRLDGDLEDTLNELIDAQPDLSAIIIETTGIAEPLPISWTLAGEALSSRVRLAAVMTVVDALEHQRHRPLSPSVDAQVDYADLLLVTKLDLCPPTRLCEVERFLRERNQVAPILAGNTAGLVRDLWCALDDPSLETVAKSEKAPAVAGTHGFESIALDIDKTIDLERLIENLEELPPTYIRIKGIAQIVDASSGQEGARMIAFHRVGARVSTEPARDSLRPRIVAIGTELDPADLSACIRASVVDWAAPPLQDDDGIPQAVTLRELLDEIRNGYSLFSPVLISVSPEAMVHEEAPTGHTITANLDVDWAEEYTREYANEEFTIVGSNSLEDGLDKPVYIGRSRQCDVRFVNDSVSKTHASIVFDRSTGGYFLIDENSRNGTFLNSEPIEPGARTPLWSGAYVSFGDAVFVFIDPPTLRKLARLSKSRR